MCVYFGPEVMIKNTFMASVDNPLYIEWEAIRRFSNILYDKISKNCSRRNGIKYVYFQLGKMDLEDFCESNSQFISGINRIYRNQEIDPASWESVNTVYSEEIQNSLKDARDEFTAGI